MVFGGEMNFFIEMYSRLYKWIIAIVIISSNSINSVNNEFIFNYKPKEEVFDSRLKIIRQFRVASQDYTSEGGGSLSCGYHALKNGLIIGRAINSNWQNERLSQALKDRDIVKELYGDLGSLWRSIVLEDAIKNLAKVVIINYIKSKLSGIRIIEGIEDFNQERKKFGDNIFEFSAFRNIQFGGFVLGDLDEKLSLDIWKRIHEYLRGKFGDLLVKKFLKKHNGVYEFKISKIDILNKISSSLNIEQTELEKYFVDLEDLSFEIKDNQISSDVVPKFLLNINFDYKSISENLNTDQIKLIIKNFSRNSTSEDNLNNIEIDGIKVLSIGDIARNVAVELGLNSDLQWVVENIENKNPILALVLVNQGGHWYCCFINNNSEGIHIYLADSFNANKFQHDMFVQLLEVLRLKKETLSITHSGSIEQQSSWKSTLFKVGIFLGALYAGKKLGDYCLDSDDDDDSY